MELEQSTTTLLEEQELEPASNAHSLRAKGHPKVSCMPTAPGLRGSPSRERRTRNYVVDWMYCLTERQRIQEDRFHWFHSLITNHP